MKVSGYLFLMSIACLWLGLGLTAEAGAAWSGPPKSVGFDWNPATPMRPGELVNITLGGYGHFEVVTVSVYDRDNPYTRIAFSVCGTIGYLTIALPDFPVGSVLQLKASAAGRPNAPLPSRLPEDRVAYSEFEYLCGDRLLVGGRANGARRARSVSGAPKSVYINGNPRFIYEKTYIVIAWQGFPSDATICTELRCPLTTDSAAEKPAYSRYADLLIYHRNPQRQIGCYVVAMECTREGGRDLGTLVRSDENYVLMLE